MKALIGVYLLGLASTTTAENTQLAALFNQHQVSGTIVIETLDGDTQYLHNFERSQQRFSPASTFKIPNSLIAIEQGLVTTQGKIFSWDGTERALPAWNTDHSMTSAFRASCVWCYQEIARKLSHDKYQTLLSAFGYGNAQTGDQLDLFWLDGSLTISALEQVKFLRKLIRGDLPIDEQTRDAVIQMMLVNDSNQPQLYAKTGWAAGDINVGWNVGFVRIIENQLGDSEKKPDQTWLFALNLDMDRIEQAPLRHKLLIESLRALSITP